MLFRNLFSFFRPNPSICYAITVNDEVEEIKRLLTFLENYVKPKDQIVVLQDITNEEVEVSKYLKNSDKISYIKGRLNGDFASFKNQLIQEANTDYLFQLDADEVPSSSLMEHLKDYLKTYYKKDCFSVPRINIVHGITDEHIQKWAWKQNEDGYINYPDYQMRIFRLDTGIRWQNKVHEVLINFKRLKTLPVTNYEYSIYHEKNITKQEQQNDFYDTKFSAT